MARRGCIWETRPVPRFAPLLAILIACDPLGGGGGGTPASGGRGAAPTPGGPHPDDALDAARDRAAAGHPTWPSVAAYCETLSAPPSAPRDAAEQDAQRRARTCATIRRLSDSEG